jgi:aspartate/methionine/tyrosine aminotransferase
MTPKVAARSGISPFHVMEVMRAAGQRAATGAEVLHLEVGQPSTPAPRPVIAAAVEAIETTSLPYTDALGASALRSRLTGWYLERYGIGVEATRIAITTGASGACLLAFLACFDIGDRVGVLVPGYPCYRTILSTLGIEAVPVRVDADTGWAPTVASLDELHARVPLDGLVVASPSNPTGTVLPADQLDELTTWCDERDMRLIVDEIYHGITFGAPAPTAAGRSTDVVVINSFSKYFSMPGWRLGWLVLPPELVEPVERLAQNLTVAPPSLAQVAAVEALDCTDQLDAHVERYARNRSVVIDGLTRAGLDEVAPSGGAFYTWVAVSRLTDDSQDLAALWLDELGVAVTPGIDFDPEQGHRWLRISFAGATQDITEAMERIVAWSRARSTNP